jgi:hypothetical protein
MCGIGGQMVTTCAFGFRGESQIRVIESNVSVSSDVSEPGTPQEVDSDNDDNLPEECEVLVALERELLNMKGRHDVAVHDHRACAGAELSVRRSVEAARHNANMHATNGNILQAMDLPPMRQGFIPSLAIIQDARDAVAEWRALRDASEEDASRWEETIVYDSNMMMLKDWIREANTVRAVEATRRNGDMHAQNGNIYAEVMMVGAFLFGVVSAILCMEEVIKPWLQNHNRQMHALNGNIEMVEMLVLGMLFLCGLAAVLYFCKVRHTFDLFDMRTWNALGFECSPAEMACWILALVGLVKLITDRIYKRSLESKSKTLEFLSGIIDSLTVVTMGYVIYKDGVKVAPKVFGFIRVWVQMLYTTINGLKFLQKYFPTGLTKSWIRPEIVVTAAEEAVQFTEELDDENVPEGRTGLNPALAGSWFRYPAAERVEPSALKTWRERAANSLATFEELMGRKKVSDLERLTGLKYGLGYKPTLFKSAYNMMLRNPLFMLIGLVAIIALLRALYKYLSAQPEVKTDSFNAEDFKPHPMTLEAKRSVTSDDNKPHPATIRACKSCNTVGNIACCGICCEDLETGRRKKKVKHVQTTYSGTPDISVDHGFQEPEPDSPINKRDADYSGLGVYEKKGKKYVAKQPAEDVSKPEAKQQKITQWVMKSKVVDIQHHLSSCVECVPRDGHLVPCQSARGYNADKLAEAWTLHQRAMAAKVQPKEQLFVNSPLVQQVNKVVAEKQMNNDAAINKKKPCRFGDHCHNDNCPLYHTTRMCASGSSCQYIGSCFFYHPEIKMTAKGKSLYSRVAKAIPQKLESLNGRKQFMAGKALAVSKGVFSNATPHLDTFDSHAVFYGGKILMTEHGFTGCDEIWICGTHIDKKRFAKSKTSVDLMIAPVPAGLSFPNVKAEIPEQKMNQEVYICATYPEVAIAQGTLVCVNGGEIAYTSATKPGDSGMGVWSCDGKLLGFHRSGGNGKPNGFIPVTQALLDEIHGVSKN